MFVGLWYENNFCVNFSKHKQQTYSSRIVCVFSCRCEGGLLGLETLDRGFIGGLSHWLTAGRDSDVVYAGKTQICNVAKFFQMESAIRCKVLCYIVNIDRRVLLDSTKFCAPL